MFCRANSQPKMLEKTAPQLADYCGVSTADEIHLAGLVQTSAWLIPTMIAIILLCKFALGRFYKGCRILKNGLTGDYLPGAIQKDWKGILGQFALGALDILLLIAVIRFFPVPWLPDNLIPESSKLFSAGYYSNAVIARLQQQNTVPLPMYYIKKIHTVCMAAALYYASLLFLFLGYFLNGWLANITRAVRAKMTAHHLR